MKKLVARASTGLDSFDQIINALRTGDNVVWQVDGIDDYQFFVTPFVHNENVYTTP